MLFNSLKAAGSIPYEVTVFLIYLILQPLYGPVVDPACKRNEY
jgi:hypothetical protein